MRATAVDADLNLWPIYDAVQCPCLLIHGMESDLLPQAVATAGFGHGEDDRWLAGEADHA